MSTSANTLGCVVFVRGVRHTLGAEAVIAMLQAGERLDVSLDAGNAFNPKALKLHRAGAAVGFLPDYLASELSVMPGEIVVVVRNVNLPPAPVHHRVLVEVTFPSSGKRPFSGPDFQPLSPDALPLVAA